LKAREPRVLSATATEIAMPAPLNRRTFLAATAAGASWTIVSRRAGASQPAALGGEPVREAPFAAWPVVRANDQQALVEVLHSGHWFRDSGQQVNQFEAAYAALTGARHCVATANGTSALLASLGALGIGPGDEVIVPPYTFVATINVVLMNYAIPVFVDTDPRTFQIDSQKVEAAITDRTAAILPVHLGGSAADLDTILAIGKRHKLPVIEDACQAVLGEWRHRKLGTWGVTGCFSLQESKNLNCGEGGAILTDDPAVAELCYAFHNNGRPRDYENFDLDVSGGRAANLRLTEFQAALASAQMTRLEQQAQIRESNAAYLTSLLREIPGISPAEMYPGCTRNAYHLYMLRYDSKHFANLPRVKFQRAMRAEGIPTSSGYTPLNQQPFLAATFNTRGYRRIYPDSYLRQWKERNHCPENDRLCDEAIWLYQSVFLGERGDMDQIAEAVRKIQAHADRLAKA
jgi:dTDP-4-amino-4,6-dideoxygalactose transaminase